MMRSILNVVVTPANSEVLASVITGSPSLNRRVVAIWFEQTASMDLRGYLNTDRVVEVASEVEAADHNPVPVDIVLMSGDEFKVGWNNGTAGSLTKHIVTFVEETPK